MAKVIMVQGTMSNVGKSVITAGLCRIFRQDGYMVAPFKSQNMALNSYITKEGLEMGRAQVMQAEAAGIDPIVAMNPILLKPTSDVGSQVIVNGTSIGTMRAKEYFEYKKSLIPEIMKAYHTLEEMFDIIVIEGAGSPAEINLKKDDIVNMGMAELVDAPVLLVGDIDRGGVFAQLFGTVELLEAKERDRVKGLIINKFRGDKFILEPGITMIEEKCNIEVVGVTPYLSVDLEEEDSLCERLEQNKGVSMIDIAIIRFPRISNFTDFYVLEQMEGVSLRYVSQVAQLGSPDVIILPGTKNTIEDCLWIRQNGFEAAILKHASVGNLVFGICGGYQMLGKTIYDPNAVEGSGKIQGLGLLPMDTVFQEEKVRTRVEGVIKSSSGILKSLDGFVIEGYEIHMGVSTVSNEEEVQRFIQITKHLTDDTNILCEMDGCCTKNVYGTYLHGFFDYKEIAIHFIKAVARHKGITFDVSKSLSYQKYKEQQYDKLADGLRMSLDMEKIYQILRKE